MKRCFYCLCAWKQHDTSCPNTKAPNKSRRLSGWRAGYKDGYNETTIRYQLGSYRLGYDMGERARGKTREYMRGLRATIIQAQFQFRDDLTYMTEDELKTAAGEYIFLSAIDGTYKESDNHWKCEFVKEECARRGKEHIYTDAPAIYV